MAPSGTLEVVEQLLAIGGDSLGKLRAGQAALLQRVRVHQHLGLDGAELRAALVVHHLLRRHAPGRHSHWHGSRHSPDRSSGGPKLAKACRTRGRACFVPLPAREAGGASRRREGHAVDVVIGTALQGYSVDVIIAAATWARERDTVKVVLRGGLVHRLSIDVVRLRAGVLLRGARVLAEDGLELVEVRRRKHVPHTPRREAAEHVFPEGVRAQAAGDGAVRGAQALEDLAQTAFQAIAEVDAVGDIAAVVEDVRDDEEARGLGGNGRLQDAERLVEALDDLVGGVGLAHAEDHRAPDAPPVHRHVPQQLLQAVAVPCRQAALGGRGILADGRGRLPQPAPLVHAERLGRPVGPRVTLEDAEELPAIVDVLGGLIVDEKCKLWVQAGALDQGRLHGRPQAHDELDGAMDQLAQGPVRRPHNRDERVHEARVVRAGAGRGHGGKGGAVGDGVKRQTGFARESRDKGQGSRCC
eukprot:m.17635 g.17635  ORF g.17635 m.17635 type:complete len:471 (-) comp3264_c0_seq2:779-2191(-)